ncbi:MAG: adenylate/guanylate cyclase domain-containing protein [Alphaproteobacteria bacterium]|nr:adenylate/guanylate cyclase domain-containing protein [Alphaproteobacteria bacterium]MDP6813303.1 adenylate/guanylate cyclase domain-containing protein [Alphaproteobacteria bacterium]
MQRRLAAILAADVAGYSRLLGEDEAGTLAALRQLRNELFRPAIAGHRGKLVKSMGDGWLIEFASAVDAVNCALQVQDRLVGNPIIKLRIGIHIGDVVHEDEDIFGDGVNIAARLQEIATPGGVMISDSTYGSLDGTLTPSFDDDGPHELKNIKRPVQTWVRGLREQTGPGEAAASPARPAGFPALAIQPVETSDARAEVRELAAALSFDAANYLSAPEWLDAAIAETAEAPDYSLQATLRARGDRLRLDVRLSSPSDPQIWLGKFDGDLGDSFDWQDQTGEAIAKAVIDRIAAAEMERLSAESEDALTAEECLLLGIVGWDAIDGSGSGFAAGLRLCRLAIEKDADLRIAYDWGVALIGAAISLGFQSHITDFLADLDNWAAKIQVGPSAAGGFHSMAVLAGTALNLDAAQRRLWVGEQLRLSPFDSAALAACGMSFVYLGEPEAALDCFTKSRRFGDYGIMAGAVPVGMAIAYVMLGKDEAAADLAERAMIRTPGYSAVYRAMASACGHLGRTEEARQSVETLLALVPGETVTAVRARSGYADNAFANRYLDGMRLAGLPD